MRVNKWIYKYLKERRNLACEFPASQQKLVEISCQLIDNFMWQTSTTPNMRRRRRRARRWWNWISRYIQRKKNVKNRLLSETKSRVEWQVTHRDRCEAVTFLVMMLLLTIFFSRGRRWWSFLWHHELITTTHVSVLNELSLVKQTSWEHRKVSKQCYR